MKKFTGYWSLITILLLSYWAIAPLSHSGFFPMHDDTQVVRIQQMAQALRDGQFPVRWVGGLGYGYGYPIFNFYAPLAYYVGGFFNLIGVDALMATKLMFGIGIILSGLFMYLLAREFWGELGGVISGLFYIYAPYHAVNVYVRGAVGEFWAMAFLPIVFLSLYKVFSSNIQIIKERWILVGTLGYAGVILSHNLTAIMTIPFIFLLTLGMVIFSKARKLLITNCLLLITSTLGISAFYWLPALFEMNFTKVFGQIGGGADFRDHFVFLDQLWASPWGFGGSAPGRLDGISFMIGKLHIVLALTSLVTAVCLWQKRKKELSFALFASFCVFAVAIFLTNQLSQTIWEAISPLAFIQYPWRFLVFTALAASFIAGSIVLWFDKIQDYPGIGTIPGLSRIGGATIILALLIFNTKYFKPQVYLGVSAKDYISEENIKWKTSKISDEYLPRDFPIPQNKNEVGWEKVAVLKGEAEIKNLNVKTHRYLFEVQARSQSEILVNTAYFPGWKVWANGKGKDPTLDNGKIKFSLPAGDYQIKLQFTNTPIRTVSNLISLISWIGLIGFILSQKKRLLPFPRCQYGSTSKVGSAF